MDHMNRRRFLQGSLLTAAAAATPLSSRPSVAEGTEVRAGATGEEDLVDVNAYIGHWPFGRLPQDDAPELEAHLRKHGVREAWTGSFEGLVHKDMAAVNARLAESVSRHGSRVLVPFGSVNPKLPDWEEDLRRVHEVHGMPGIRVHPGYHAYPLDDPAFAELLQQANRRRLVVQVVPWMQDERHHIGLMQVPTPSLMPLADLARRMPELRIVVLNGFRSSGGQDYAALAKVGNVHFDFAKLDVIDPLTDFMTEVPATRVVFGSYAPAFYVESALLKMQESELTEEQRRAIRSGNARRLLASV